MAVTITIKNIPSQLYEALKQSAVKNHRSINSEIMFVIEKQYSSTPIMPEEYLERARKVRKKNSGIFLTQEFLDDAKGEGRA